MQLLNIVPIMKMVVWVNYDAYEALYPKLKKEEENLSDEEYKCVIKWSKIENKGNNNRSCQRCYGAPFMLDLD